MTMLKPVNPSHRRTNAADVNRWTGGAQVSVLRALLQLLMTLIEFHCYIPFVEYGIFVGWHKIYYSLDFCLWLDGEYFYKGLQVLWLCF